MNYAAKIVKAERSDKCKTQFCDLAFPRRLLSYPEIVKAERSDKCKTQFCDLALPRRLRLVLE